MIRRDVNKDPWLPNVQRNPNSDIIWVEQIDGTFIPCDPIRFSIYIKELVTAFAGAAYSRLSVVEPEPEMTVVFEPHDDLVNIDPE